MKELSNEPTESQKRYNNFVKKVFKESADVSVCKKTLR